MLDDSTRLRGEQRVQMLGLRCLLLGRGLLHLDVVHNDCDLLFQVACVGREVIERATQLAARPRAQLPSASQLHESLVHFNAQRRPER